MKKILFLMLLLCSGGVQAENIMYTATEFSDGTAALLFLTDEQTGPCKGLWYVAHMGTKENQYQNRDKMCWTSDYGQVITIRIPRTGSIQQMRQLFGLVPGNQTTATKVMQRLADAARSKSMQQAKLLQEMQEPRTNRFSQADMNKKRIRDAAEQKFEQCYSHYDQSNPSSEELCEEEYKNAVGHKRYHDGGDTLP